MAEYEVIKPENELEVHPLIETIRKALIKHFGQGNIKNRTFSVLDWRTAEQVAKKRFKELSGWRIEYHEPEYNALKKAIETGNFEGLPDEREKYTTSGSKNTTVHFDKKGNPKQPLKNVYRWLRGNAYVDEEGNVVGQTQAPFTYRTSLPYRNLIKDRVIVHTPDSRLTIIPREIVRKIDPYYKDYITSINEFLKDSDYESDSSLVQSIRNKFGYLMSLAAIKNASKSTNKERALHDVRQYIDDFFTRHRRLRGGRIIHDDLDANDKAARTFDSLNQMRDQAEQYREDDIREERERVERQAIRDAEDRRLGRMTQAEIEEEMEAKRIEPFDYSEDVQQTVDQTGWKLAESRQDLINRGNDMHHCVGSYGERVFKHDCLILMKDDQTAEITLDVSEKDDGSEVIDKTRIVQVKGPRNKVLEPDTELKMIAKNLKGKRVDNNVDEDTTQQETDICDIFCKTIFKPSILTAIKEASRLIDKTPSEEGTMLGVPHNAVTQTNNLATKIASMRY